MARITGIGGVFFKANDPRALGAWYQKHLGLSFEEWGGAILKWPDDKAEDQASPCGASPGATASGSRRAPPRS